jgi:hypothetical protein
LPANTSSATLSLGTDENATCRYGNVVNTAYASLPFVFSSTGGTSHTSLIPNLVNGNTYIYQVRCIDASGNANSSDLQITWNVAVPTPTPAPTPSPSPVSGGGGGGGGGGSQVTTNSATAPIPASREALIRSILLQLIQLYIQLIQMIQAGAR